MTLRPAVKMFITLCTLIYHIIAFVDLTQSHLTKEVINIPENYCMVKYFQHVIVGTPFLLKSLRGDISHLENNRREGLILIKLFHASQILDVSNCDITY